MDPRADHARQATATAADRDSALETGAFRAAAGRSPYRSAVSAAPIEAVVVRARLLLVEPDDVLRDAVAYGFVGAGYTVASAATRTEAEGMLESFAPDVVVCEANLADGTGDAICRRLKANPMKLIPVVLVGGIAEPELERRAQRAGADRYHCKGRGLGRLAALVEELASEILF